MMNILAPLGMIVGGTWQVLRLCGWVTLAVSVLMGGSCAVERLASRQRTAAELAMVRGAAAENQRVAETERRLRQKTETAYRRARKAHADTERQAATALAELKAATRDVPTEIEAAAESAECPLPCTVPERLRRIIEGLHVVE